MAGATGATGPSGTATFFSSVNTAGSTIAVVLGGTAVPLPTFSGSGFTANGTFDTFTATTTSSYVITYAIRLTAPLTVSSQVLQNSTPIAQSISSPTAATDLLTATFSVSLTTGDTLQLQLFGLLGSATLASGNGASMSVIQVGPPPT